MQTFTDAHLIALLPDFRRRCSDANHRIESGHPSPIRNSPDQFGLPLEFTMAAIALATALTRALSPTTLARADFCDFFAGTFPFGPDRVRPINRS